MRNSALDAGSFNEIVVQILIDRPLQREFAKEDDFGQTLRPEAPAMCQQLGYLRALHGTASSYSVTFQSVRVFWPYEMLHEALYKFIADHRGRLLPDSRGLRGKWTALPCLPGCDVLPRASEQVTAERQQVRS
jgi:hypothetical protein